VRLLPVLFFILFACGTKYNHSIEIPKASSTYYENSVKVIEKQLEEQSNNIDLIELQLEYSSFLGWPEYSAGYVERAISHINVSPQIRVFVLDYYQNLDQPEEQLKYIESLEKLGPINNEEFQLKIDALIAIDNVEKSILILRKKLADNPTADNQLKLARLFNKIDNTPLAMFHFYKAYESGVRDTVLLSEYVPLLVKYKYYDLSNEILNNLKQYSGSKNYQKLSAQVIYQFGDRDSAERILKNIPGIDSYYQLTDWYKTSNRYDSAITYFNKILSMDSSELDALVGIADIEQNRYFLNNAYKYYSLAIKTDSTNNYIREQLDNVERKIAYLRRIREQSNETPVLNIESKGIN